MEREDTQMGAEATRRGRKRVSVYRVLGMMSGTSLDGMDAAISEFRFEPGGAEGEGGRWSGEMLQFEGWAFPGEWRDRLACLPEATAMEWHRTAAEWSAWCGQQARERLDLTGVQLAGFHGQTVFHQPDQGFTGQLASGAHVHAALGGIPVVCDFRSLDVALGGQGAPLVPLVDALLFSDVPACLNLGGFSNISFPDATGQRIAWDVGPCNLLLNALAGRLGADCDRDGQWAAEGTVDAALWRDLMGLPYHGWVGPRRLGREWLESQVLPRFAGREGDRGVRDALATATHYVASTVRAAASGRTTWITGGGAHNRYLMALLAAPPGPHLTGPPVPIAPAAQRWIDGKEAHAFGFLALRRALGLETAWPAVTGARVPSCGGALWGHFVP